MPQTEWGRLCEGLAEELRAACSDVLAPADLRLEDRTDSMLAAEEDPRVVPYYPIGLLHRYRLHDRRVHRLFGRRWLPIRHWKMIAHFGLEEMFNAPFWTCMQGMWCVVYDGRLVEPSRQVMQRFSAAHRIKLDFAPRAA
jgi:hypothetical protein